MPLTLTHWGAYEVDADDGRVRDVRGAPFDPDPSPIGRSLRAIDRARVLRPAVRRSWLDGGPGTAGHLRGSEPFVEVDWDVALDLVAGELERVRSEHGGASIYSGSYGWASAGRFHHAQSQLRRFMAIAGGSTTSRNSYSLAAAEVVVPHILGMSFEDVQYAATSWENMARHTGLFVAFGGVPVKNSQIQHGGIARHRVPEHLERCRDAGVHFVNVSPIADDLGVGAEWIPIRPNTDTALMLALVHELVATDRIDRDFVDRYTEGWDRFEDSVMGRSDEPARDPRWAEEVCGIDAGVVERLAADMAVTPTMLNVSWSLQRADHGEQSYWAVVALAAALGQIGRPGAGFGMGYGAVGTVGNGVPSIRMPRVPAPPDPVEEFIPVARIADMLLHPGEPFDYDGARYAYPDVRLVYWAGGNPFHHHQDLGRLERAWAKPETIVVHEPFWTAAARRADVVLPATTPLERDDIGGARVDDVVIAMPKIVEPIGEARDDHAIFAGLAHRLGFGDRFTGGRSVEEWLRWMYDDIRARFGDLPDYDAFRREGMVEIPRGDAASHVLLADFRADPEGSPLPTPSGRIEIHSATVASFAYDDCPGHPVWFEPAEWLGATETRHPLHLVSNQPRTRLHSQYDHGETSTDAKVEGREPVRMHPDEAAARGIADGDAVRLFNDRGACFAGAVLDDAVMPGVVQLSTGAWYDPDPDTGACRHGNPNVLTRDVGTSRLAQGPTAHTCLVEVERVADPPEPRPFDPPVVAES